MQLGLIRLTVLATFWYLADGCSGPDAPSNLGHVAFGSFRINITWDAVTTSPVPDSYQVKDSSGTTHGGMTTNYFEWPSTLVASTQYKFDVRSVYNCPTNSSDVFSAWVEVTTYTGPEQPVIQQSDYTSTSIEVDVVDSNQYDTIRLFVESTEVSPSPSLWPVEVTDLTPGRSYTFYVIATKYGWSAQSENISWCTRPDVPTNLYSVTRFFYGFNVKFDQPNSGFYTGYEVWVNADSVWHKTLDDNGVFQEHYYFYNFDVATDFNRNQNIADLYAMIYNAPKDFAYNTPHGSLSSIQSGTNYVIKARTFHTCTVQLPGASQSSQTFYSEEVVGSALTGAHPVVKIQTVPVSETEIDISFEPFSTFPTGELTFNIYRYFNNTTPEQKKIENITLADLPFRDSNLQSASVYTYDISVVFGGYETFDYSRVALEAEYWPGTRGDPRNRPKYKNSLPDPYTAYQFDFNREANWKDFAADDGTPPTFVNIYDISADHNLFHFYFREKTTCTFPPAPNNVTFTLISDTALGLAWDVTDFSHAQQMHHSEYGSINITTSILINDTVMHTIPDDYSTSGSVNVTGLSGKSLFNCQVVISLSCPDDKTHLDTYDYGYAKFDYIDYYQFVDFNMDRGQLDPARDILSSNSASNPGLDQVVCYTAPSPISITSVDPGVSDPRTEVKVTYTQPDPSPLSYEVTLTSETSQSPHLNHTVTSSDTTATQTLSGLLPGQPYNVTARSSWEVTSGVFAYSESAPFEVTSLGYVTLTANGQQSPGDPMFACTDPANFSTFYLSPVNSSAIRATFTSPPGLTRRYQFDLYPASSPSYSINVTGTGGGGLYAGENESFEEYFHGFVASETVNVSITIETGCGMYLESKQLQFWIILDTKPETPIWVPSGIHILNSSSIQLQFNDSSVGASVIYTLFRNGAISPDPENNGTAKVITDDTGLLAGTVYEYYVVANSNGDSSVPSDVLTICTNPDPPSLAIYSNRRADSFDVSWRRPSIGSATGFYLNETTFSYANQNTTSNSFTFTGLSALQEYELNTTLQSYLMCNVSFEQPRGRVLLSDTAYTESIKIPVYLTVPVWLVDRCETVSSTSVYLEFNHTVQDPAVTYILYRDGVVSTDPDNNGTNKSITDDTGLQPGTVYLYTVASSTNGEVTNQSDVLQMCTNPGNPTSFAVSNRQPNSADLSWNVPSLGSVSGYYLNDTLGNTNLKTRDMNLTYSGLNASESYELNVSVVSYLECNVTTGATTHEIRELKSDFTYEISLTIPPYLTVPYWVLSLTRTLSSTSIYLVINDTSPSNNSIITYTLFRDGIVSTHSENNGTAKSITDDTGLQSGTVYEYEVTASVNGETTERSEKLQICTNPDPPQLAIYENRTASSVDITWTAPSAGSVSGYYLSDNMGNNNIKINQSKYSYESLSATQSYQLNISLQSYLECNVTGESIPRELLSDTPYNTSFEIPEYLQIPQWVPALSITLSASAIYLEWNASNPLGTIYTVYRDSNPLSDSENNSTNTFLTDDTGLQPGTMYQYTVTATIGGETTGHSAVLEICTDPAQPSSLKLDNRTIDTAVVKWAAPAVGTVTGYYITDNLGNTNTKRNEETIGYTLLSAVQSYTVNINLQSYLECNVTGESQPRELLSPSYHDSVIIPQYLSTPFWLPSSSLTMSSTAIYIQFNDSNPTGTTYTIFRDGTALSDPENNSTNKFLTDDTGLQSGTVYLYTVVASTGSEMTPVSSSLQICTNPDTPHSALLSNRSADSALISWTAPSTGSFSGFRVSDNLFNNNYVNVASTTISYLSLSAVSSYRLEISLQTYLECNVTGDPIRRQLLSDSYNATINIPQYLSTPNWIPTLSVTLSASAIYLEWNASNPLGTIYTVYRDSIQLSDSENNSTNTFLTDDTGLQPGTMYQYTVTATIGTETTPMSSIFEICTEPVAPASVSYQNRQTTSVELTWTAPTIGSATGYYLSDNRGNANVKTQQQLFTYTGLAANQDYVINVTIRSYLDCDVTGDPATRELLSANELNASVFISREGEAVVPLWTPALSQTQSSTSIYLEFTDLSPTATPTTIYTISRNGAIVTSSANNLPLMTSFLDDNNGGGLDPGTTYDYRVTATDFDGSQRESEILSICTNPGVPSSIHLVALGSSSSFQLTWSAPSAGSVSGYYLTDNVGHTNMRIIPNQYNYVGLNASAEYELSVSVTSYLECDVTGETPVRELSSDTSVNTTIHACTAPATPYLQTDPETFELTFVASISIPSGVVSRLQLMINRELASHPTSAEGVFTRIDPLDASKFYFYPTYVDMNSPDYVAVFDGLIENEIYSFEISAIYDGVHCPSAYSKSSKIRYKHTKASLILGLKQHYALIAISGTVAGVIIVTALAIYFMNVKMLAAKLTTSVAPVYQISNRVEFMRPQRAKVYQPQPREDNVKKFDKPVAATSFSSAVASTSQLIREPTSEVLRKLKNQRRGACTTPM